MTDFPIVSGRSTFICLDTCMICNRHSKSTNTVAVPLDFYPNPQIVYCDNPECKKAAEYNQLRILCENDRIYEDKEHPLFDEETTQLVSIRRSNGSVTDGCHLDIGYLPRLSNSDIYFCVKIAGGLEKWISLRDLITLNPWIQNKFKTSGGIHLIFKDHPYWSHPSIKEFRENVERVVQAVNKEYE